MRVARTEKQFTKADMPIDFIKRTMAIACSESFVLTCDDELFITEISFEGRMKNGGGSVSPYNDDDSRHQELYDKKVSCVYIRIKNSFDSYARIFDKNASLQGFFNQSEKVVCQINTVKWTNLLLEYGFLECEPCI